ncbi:hypothetical protein CWI37_0265p0010 [Hamiltosporidium tvaerminnensis]|uniref:Uncharacterized protein n=1 Tax=Hamiltosporidium tvaerminnensis TaxID=1176355 RepID=A0A4Q9L7I5_9MICR|nr:Chromatin assembly factor 1 subunit B [Hamiltosporidium tvaerminnensis]TBU03617.1 hypothetical protein CWI37_0265p0010 [Hamiltosporidium tvaerminnensis]
MKNVETTTHNLYFHDNASIFSIDVHHKENLIATCGSDKAIRIWKMEINSKLKQNEVTVDAQCRASNEISIKPELDNFIEEEINSTPSDEKEESSNEISIKPELDNFIEEEINSTPSDEKEESNNEISIKPELDNFIEEDNKNSPPNVEIKQEPNSSMNFLQSTGFKMKYFTAANSSLRFVYSKTLLNHSRSVNCVRFSICGKYLASCSDGGEIVVYSIYDNETVIVRGIDGDDAYDICWGKDYFFVGFGSGFVRIYKVKQNIVFNSQNVNLIFEKTEDSDKSPTTDSKTNEDENKKNIKNNKRVKILQENPYSFSVTETFSQKIHSDLIQGISYNLEFSLFTTFSRDRSCKTFFFNEKKIKMVEKIEGIFCGERSKSFFRRGCYSSDGKFLYLCSGLVNSSVFSNESKNIPINPTLSHIANLDGKKTTHCIFVLHYPFKYKCLYAILGPFDSAVTKIVYLEEKLFVVTKKSIYVFENQNLLFCVANIGFLPVTDGVFWNNYFIISSLDGFLSSIKIS